MAIRSKPAARANRSPARQQHGFTLLEAIVALVLISSAGMALFSWINNNISTLSRIHDANTQSEATLNILEYMRLINPMLTPQGKAALGNYRIDWESQPATLIVDKPSSLYQFALYQTRIGVEDSDGRAWFELSLQQVGYKQVRLPLKLD